MINNHNKPAELYSVTLAEVADLPLFFACMCVEESREERSELEEEFLAPRLSDNLINLSCVCCFLPIQWK